MEKRTEAQALSAAAGNTETLQHLGGIQRTKESTIDAVGNVLGGLKQVILPNRKQNESRFKGVTKIAEGAFNAIDIVPSALADAGRSLAGPDRQAGSSPYNYNISRGLGSFKHVEKPRHAIGAIIDTTHALTTRLGTDAIRAIRGQAA